MNLDPNGIFKYNQLKRVISPKWSCNVNSICCAYEIRNQSDKCWDFCKNYHTEYTSPADKFMYFLRHESMILEIYKFINPKEYNKWIKDETKDKDLYSDNSIPQNEVLKILCIGFNLFVNMSNGDNYISVCELKELSMKEIYDYIIHDRIPLVASFDLNHYGHIMTICGGDTNHIFVEDSYGMSYLKEHKEDGKSKIIPITEFKHICKPMDVDKKLCIIFK